MIVGGADTVEIYIDRGATWQVTFRLRDQQTKIPIDLTGATASLVLAASWGGASVLSLSGGSGLTIDIDAGTIAAVATDEQTALLTADVYYGYLQTALSGAIDRKVRIIAKMQP